MALAIRDVLSFKRAGMLELILLAFLIVFIVSAYAEDGPGDLIIISGCDVNLITAELGHAYRSSMDGQVSFLDLPLWIKVAHISSSIGTILGSLIIIPAVIRKAKESLPNKNRESIINYITKNPGCIISHIVNKEKISRGTARYHLIKLRSEGKIILKRMGKALRIFISSRALSDKEKTVAVYTSNEKDRTILYTILECEGSTNQYLSDKLHMSKSDMHKYLKKYEGSGMVQFKLEDRNKKYFFDIEAKDILAKYKNSTKA